MKVTKGKVTADRFLSGTFAALADALGASSPPISKPSEGTTTAAQIMDQKSIEIERQICRVSPYLDWVSNEKDTGVDEAGLNWSISFLRAFANSPAPIPMLAVSNDGKAAAYLNKDNMSLEATFEDNVIQYLLSDLKSGSCKYFEESSENGKIPPNVMVVLYQHFARNSSLSLEKPTKHE